MQELYMSPGGGRSHHMFRDRTNQPLTILDRILSIMKDRTYSNSYTLEDYIYSSITDRKKGEIDWTIGFMIDLRLIEKEIRKDKVGYILTDKARIEIGMPINRE